MIAIMSDPARRFYAAPMTPSNLPLRPRPARLLAAACLLALATVAPAQTVREHVHHHGHEVMPFDLARTVHVFRMTEDGGTQKVIVRGEQPDPEQVRLVQHHLAMEAAQFRQGNFADPMHLHGAGMPGLREMQAAAPKMQITYSPLPNGGEIRFRTSDIALVTVVHRWFGAQLSEHGADARLE
jgi:hypothetical protein